MKRFSQLKLLVVGLCLVGNTLPMMNAARSGVRVAQAARVARTRVNKVPVRKFTALQKAGSDSAPKTQTTHTTVVVPQSNWLIDTATGYAKRFFLTSPKDTQESKVLSVEEVKENTERGCESVLDSPDGPEIARQTLKHYLKESAILDIIYCTNDLLKKLPKEEAHDFAVKIFNFIEPKSMHLMSYAKIFDFLKTKKDRGIVGLKILEQNFEAGKIQHFSDYYFEHFLTYIPEDTKADLCFRIADNFWGGDNYNCLNDLLSLNRNECENQKVRGVSVLEALSEKDKIYFVRTILLNKVQNNISFLGSEALLELLPSDGKLQVSKEVLTYYLESGGLAINYQGGMFFSYEFLNVFFRTLCRNDRLDIVKQLIEKQIEDESRLGVYADLKYFFRFQKEISDTFADDFCEIVQVILEEYLEKDEIHRILDEEIESLLSCLSYEQKLTLAQRHVTKEKKEDCFFMAMLEDLHTEHKKVEDAIQEQASQWKEKGVGNEIYTILNKMHDPKEKAYFGKKILVDWCLNEAVPAPRLNAVSIFYDCGFTPKNDQELWAQIKASANFEETLIRGLDTATSVHVAAHYDSALGVIGTCLKKGSTLAEVAVEAHDYSAAMEAAGRVTFFHGQGWQWTLYERIARNMLERAFNEKVSDEFRVLRYMPGNFFKGEAAQKVVRKGVTDFATERSKVLFTTLSLGASRRGSSPLAYVAAKTDQSIIQGKNAQDLKAIFESWYRHGDAYEAVCAKTPELIEDIMKLHDELYAYGNLITIDTPLDVADSLAYPTESGGPLRLLEIDGQGLTKISEIMEMRKKWPFKLEIGIPLDRDKFATHRNAADADIVIREWNKARMGHLESLIDDLINQVKEEKRRKSKLEGNKYA